MQQMRLHRKASHLLRRDVPDQDSHLLAQLTADCAGIELGQDVLAPAEPAQVRLSARQGTGRLEQYTLRDGSGCVAITP